MSRFYVYPYRSGSRSARALADALSGRVIRLSGSHYHHRNTKVVINWGSCNCPHGYSALNPSILTTEMRDKTRAFRKLSDGSSNLPLPCIPRWTESRPEALEWLSRDIQDGGVKEVVSRATVTGQGGSGIVVIDRDEKDTLPTVPLYVEYIPKDSEYRVHVFKNNNGGYDVIDVQRKIRDPGRTPTDWRIRSHGNGFVFARNSGGVPYKDTCPVDVRDEAVRAVAVSGLTFSAVDVVWNAHRGKAYVLELNQAPGLEGATVGIYRDAVLRYVS